MACSYPLLSTRVLCWRVMEDMAEAAGDIQAEVISVAGTLAAGIVGDPAILAEVADLGIMAAAITTRVHTLAIISAGVDPLMVMAGPADGAMAITPAATGIGNGILTIIDG